MWNTQEHQCLSVSHVIVSLVFSSLVSRVFYWTHTEISAVAIQGPILVRINQHKQRSRQFGIFLTLELTLLTCVVFWCPVQSAWCTGRRRGANRWECHANKEVQSKFLTFWLKYGPKHCTENRCLRSRSVSGTTSICWRFSDIINKGNWILAQQ